MEKDVQFQFHVFREKKNIFVMLEKMLDKCLKGSCCELDKCQSLKIDAHFELQVYSSFKYVSDHYS